VVTQREPALVTPFWVRIATETNVSPGWLLVAIPGVLYPTYLVLEVLFGRGLAAATDFAGDWEARRIPMMAVNLGYLAMMATYVARGTFRDLEALGPVIEGGDAVSVELRRKLSRFEGSRLWFGAFVGVAFSLVAGELAQERWTRLVAGQWSLQDAGAAVMILLTWVVAGCAAMYVVDSARLYSRIGERHVKVDLLDPTPLSPLTRHGLRIVLLLVIMMAFYLIIVATTIGFNSRSLGSMTVVLLTSLLYLLLATAAFLLPVRGLRRQIRARKAEELVRVREKIRRDRELAEGLGTESAEAGGRLPGLLAYAKTVESVREWPFDAPTLTRFFLYVAIPLGSWVGGALVERLLGAALD
jgi:hypothetical protein